jgi:hypothetical protein
MRGRDWAAYPLLALARFAAEEERGKEFFLGTALASPQRFEERELATHRLQ